MSKRHCPKSAFSKLSRLRQLESGSVLTVLLVIFFLALATAAGILGYYYLTAGSLKSLIPTLTSTAEIFESQPTETPQINPFQDDKAYLEAYKNQEWNPEFVLAEGVVLEVSSEQQRILKLQFTWPPQITDKIKEVTLLCTDEDFSVQDAKIFIDGKGLSHDEFIKKVESSREKVSPSEFFRLASSLGNKSVLGACQDTSCSIIKRSCGLIINQ